jgi:UDP-N-acetylglucosamine:LPS N-acetylglucosamine transferase
VHKILFFSRGRGRGHAIPTLCIASELEALCPDLDLHFASYATGAATLAESRRQVTDLRLPEDPAYLDVQISAGCLIRELRPSLILSHEEFAVVPLARSMGVPVAFIVDFFSSLDHIYAQSVAYADEVIFIEERGLFPEPKGLQGRIRYVGPVVRGLSCTAADRDAARRELNVPSAAKLVAVIPGAWASEQRVPIASLLLEAFQAVPGEKRLIWVSGRDLQSLSERAAGHPEVSVVPSFAPIERLMVASDLVVTKANRGTTIDAASLGVRSLSLSHGLNPIDETIIPRIPSNTALNAKGIDAVFLGGVLTRLLSEEACVSRPLPDERYRAGGAGRAAAALADFIHSRLPATAFTAAS